MNQLEKNPCLHLTGGLSSKFEIGTLGNGESSLLGEQEPITHNEEMHDSAFLKLKYSQIGTKDQILN